MRSTLSAFSLFSSLEAGLFRHVVYEVQKEYVEISTVMAFLKLCKQFIICETT